jgi:hypothetical protein
MGSLYGFEIRSELPLRRLNAARGRRGELSIEVAANRLEPPAAEPVSTLVDEGGRRWYASYELDGGQCLIELPPSTTFLLDPDPGRLLVESSEQDTDLLEHRIVSSAACTLLAMRGDLVLHASAVETVGGAVVFCGPTQRGKSSLARVLGLSGHGVLGEDGIAIELSANRVMAFPGARGVRVRSRDTDGRDRTDLSADPGPGEPAPCPLAAVVLLAERSAELRVEPLEPALALALLTPNLVHSGSRAAIAAAFAQLATLLRSVPAFNASLPDDLAVLPQSAPELLDAVAAAG